MFVNYADLNFYFSGCRLILLFQKQITMQKIRTALLSYGMSGKVFHAPFLKFHPGFELVGAWERTRKNIRQEYPKIKSYDSFDALLNDNIDLVVVNTPVDTHFDYAKKALLAGKHTLVEKAFTTTAAEAQELDKIAKKFRERQHNEFQKK